MVNDFMPDFWWILPIFGGSGALFEARSWGEVGRMNPNSKSIKTRGF
jgi:hypothetical protein